ncbi:ABC transporter ATP-binding protein [Variovorax sp. J2P1-59]|uniref:ABC transporter ATP-binding protein n=1 Tax=Variovorax flavidus TaxID=3053501 RepID=UPI002575DCE2|nr:ABC transporter ATP-binding protein [Variovorax sp. J2P1-59]MDM0077531.1 ABC transporter ATP-binding protein [Variovorax sp. J2P1-59]
MLELEGVCKTYSEGDIEVQALHDVNLSLDASSFCMIVGPSGSGKSTLLNLIGTLDRPTRGRVLIEGQDVNLLPDRELTRFRAGRIGFIFQSFNLMPVLTAFENVEYALLQTGMPKAQRRARTEELIEAVGLGAHRAHRPNQLSGGQRQRVAIARALVKRPALVLADEPTANLDSSNGLAIVELMRDMQRCFDTSFVFSTHDPMLLGHADQVLYANDGRVTGEALKAHPGESAAC